MANLAGRFLWVNALTVHAPPATFLQRFEDEISGQSAVLVFL
jgi:hypothetical protein